MNVVRWCKREQLTFRQLKTTLFSSKSCFPWIPSHGDTHLNTFMHNTAHDTRSLFAYLWYIHGFISFCVSLIQLLPDNHLSCHSALLNAACTGNEKKNNLLFTSWTRCRYGAGQHDHSAQVTKEAVCWVFLPFFCFDGVYACIAGFCNIGTKSPVKWTVEHNIKAHM